MYSLQRKNQKRAFLKKQEKYKAPITKKKKKVKFTSAFSSNNLKVKKISMIYSKYR